jgi:hypothetical protein
MDHTGAPASNRRPRNAMSSRELFVHLFGELFNYLFSSRIRAICANCLSSNRLACAPTAGLGLREK